MKHTVNASCRRGSTLYITVMGVGMIVGMIALTTSLTGRVQLRMNQDHRHTVAAAAGARNGIEYALNWINRTTDWRSQLTSGVDSSPISTPDGHFRFRVTDVDGDLNDDPRDHAVLRAVGYSQGARHAVEIDIEPAGRSLSCFETAAYAGQDFNVGEDAAINGSGVVAAGNTFNAQNSDINLDVEAGNGTNGNGYNAKKSSGIPAREMPSEHAFDWYLEHGTEIALSDLDESFGIDYFEEARLSRGVNEYGTPNPHGIYWIDCAGTSPRIRWSRLHGTLVLLNAGASTRVDDVSLLQTEAQNYPVLMVDGDLQLDLRSLVLGQKVKESFWLLLLNLGANLNPTGMPYQGVEDDDRDDEYPALLEGIVYATGRITIRDEVDVKGNLIANEIVINDDQTLKVDHTPFAHNYPPPGFSAGRGARALPGSYRQVSLDGE